MANLKDIGYGIGKYLVASDASAIPDIGTNRKNLDLLNFKVATNNAYALYNFKDGMIDAYQTEAGVDTAGSSGETYDSTNKYYSPVGTSTAFNYTGSEQNYTVPTGVTSLVFKAWGAGGGNGGYLGAGAGYATGTIAVTAGNVLKIIVGGGGTNGGGSEGAGGGGLSGIFYPTGLDAPSALLIAGGGGGAGRSTNSNPGSGGGASGTDALNNAPSGLPDNGGHGGTQVGGGPAGTPNGPGGSSTSGSQFQGGNAGNGSATGGYGGGGNGSTGGGGPGGGGGGWYGGGGGGNTGGGGGGSGYAHPSNVTSATLTSGGNPSFNVYDAGNMIDPDYPWGGIGMGAKSAGTGGHGYVVIAGGINNIILLSNAQTAQAAPEEGRLMIYEEDVDTITLDTDIKGYVSRDGGTTYTQTPLVEDTSYQARVQGGIDSNTKLMLHCDGANDGTTFTDSSASAHTVTPAGNAHTDTAIKKFGTASLQLDGTGDWLSVPDSEDWNFAAGDFTIDFWTRFNDSDQEYRMIGTYQDIQNFWRIEKRRDDDAAGELNFRWTTGNSNNILLQGAPLTWADDTWYHLAVVRNGNVFTMYRDGINVGQETNSTTLSNFTSPLTVGVQDTTGTGASPVNGYMDEIRISKGVARFTEAFTPATRLSEAYNDGEYATSQRLLSGSVDISGQPSGTSMKYKIETLNNKNLKLHGASLLWA